MTIPSYKLPAAFSKPVKLDLGASEQSPEGFLQMGFAHGTQIYPLPAFADNSVDVIRCSHALEHFPHGKIAEVLKEWVRVLKPGGELKIAVPNFEWIAENYVAGQPINTLGYVMGGQVDNADHHKAIFDKASLTKQFAAAGLMLVKEWKSELQDCAALPVSLNLCGTKPHQSEMSVSAVMSMPRLAFTDNLFAAIEALPPLGIRLRKHTGAYWSQCIERVIQETIEEDNPDAILTLDYDTVFSKRDVSMLIQLMCCRPEAHAIAAMQSGRGKDLPLFTIKADNGANASQIAAEEFEPDLKKISTAHFGLTLMRADKFKALPRPWFQDVPAPDMTWGEGRRDADVSFWDKWNAAGNSLYNANRVPVGHLELTVLWPGKDLRAIHQPISDYRANGISKDAWA
jgi:SAM-dependent methyltransferase